MMGEDLIVCIVLALAVLMVVLKTLADSGKLK